MPVEFTEYGRVMVFNRAAAKPFELWAIQLDGTSEMKLAAAVDDFKVSGVATKGR